MKAGKTNLYFILITISLLVCCASKPGQKEYLEIVKSPASNENEILDKFSKYPIDKQIDIYLFAECCVEGGGTFIRYLGFNGKEKIPSIVKRIDESDNPITKTKLLNALEFIDLNCECLVDSPGTLNILEKNEMRIDESDSQGIKTFKELYSTYLQRIKSRKH